MSVLKLAIIHSSSAPVLTQHKIKDASRLSWVLDQIKIRTLLYHLQLVNRGLQFDTWPLTNPEVSCLRIWRCYIGINNATQEKKFSTHVMEEICLIRIQECIGGTVTCAGENT